MGKSRQANKKKKISKIPNPRNKSWFLELNIAYTKSAFKKGKYYKKVGKINNH